MGSLAGSPLHGYSPQMAREADSDFSFESAVQAVIDGDTSSLSVLLQTSPELAQARSARAHQRGREGGRR